jgi:hypothetical protein
MDKSLILNKLKKHFNFKNDFEFAEYLGIEQNTLSSWKNRNTLNYDKIIAKCTDLKSILILTGKDEEFDSALNSNKKEVQLITNNSDISLLKQLVESQNETISLQRSKISELEAKLNRGK